MNTETREIRDASDLTPAERSSGQWIPVAKKYIKKQPISDADHARILAAHERRMRRNAKRLEWRSRRIVRGTRQPLEEG